MERLIRPIRKPLAKPFADDRSTCRLRRLAEQNLTPGQFLALKTEAAQPVRYKFGKTVTYMTSDGKVIEASKIRKDSKVHVHYIKEGNDILVDKVIATQDRD